MGLVRRIVTFALVVAVSLVGIPLPAHAAAGEAPSFLTVAPDTRGSAVEGGAAATSLSSLSQVRPPLTWPSPLRRTPGGDSLLNGTLIGAAVGVGVFVGVLCGFRCGEYTGMAALYGAGIGAAIGAGIDAMNEQTHSAVPLKMTPRLRVSPVLGKRGQGIRASLRF